MCCYGSAVEPIADEWGLLSGLSFRAGCAEDHQVVGLAGHLGVASTGFGSAFRCRWRMAPPWFSAAGTLSGLGGDCTMVSGSASSPLSLLSFGDIRQRFSGCRCSWFSFRSSCFSLPACCRVCSLNHFWVRVGLHLQYPAIRRQDYFQVPLQSLELTFRQICHHVSTQILYVQII